MNAYRFSLQTPGSTEDDVPGLMTGMQSFPNSTSLSEWGAQNWEASGSPWTILYGSGVGGGATIPVVKLGTESAPYFSSTTQTVDSTGSTNSVSVEAGVGIKAKIGIFGISETLKGGYDGEWSTETTSETEFSALTGTATITNGLVNNPDLQGKSPLMQVQGNGTANLVTEALDYRITATLVDSLEGRGELTGRPIPVSITGTFAKPKVRVDLEQVLKQEVQKQVEEKLQDKLKGGLKGLFGR